MTEARFTLSAFGDEIAPDLEDQVRVLGELDVKHLELRAAWGINVLKLDDDQVVKAKQVCADGGISVSGLGSPVGKSPLLDPIENELNNLSRLYQIAKALGTRVIRIFSFYPPDTSSNAHYDQHLPETIERLQKMAEHAQQAGFYLMLENEKGIVGDTVARCKAIFEAIDNPHMRLAWDPANFVQVSEANLTDRGWPILGQYVGYVHIKDAVLADGSVRPAGEGDGQVGELLDQLKAAGYQGFLALEPHLKVAGHSSGFSGAGGMATAVEALRKLMTAHGCTETG